MRPRHRADNVMGIINIGHPVTHGFVHGIFQRLRTGGYWDDVGTHQLHAIDVQALTMNIFFTHVDIAGQTEPCCHCCCSNTVLTGASFSNHARFAHTLG